MFDLGLEFSYLEHVPVLSINIWVPHNGRDVIMDKIPMQGIDVDHQGHADRC